jgi:hypothetical protein
MRTWFLAMFLVAGLLCGQTIMAADYTILWLDAADATGFKIYQQVNGGAWSTTGLDVGKTTSRTITVSDTAETCFRINVYNAVGEMSRPDVKVCVDPRLKLPGVAKGQGIQ